MKIYDLMRAIDQTGISGVGRVAQIIEFDSGKVVAAWCAEGRPKSVATYDSMDEAKGVHGHSGSQFVLVFDTTQSHEVGLAKELFELRELFKEVVREIERGQIHHFGFWSGHCPQFSTDSVKAWRAIIDGWIEA